MPDPREIFQVVGKAINRTPIGSRWNRIKAGGKILTAAYYAAEIVRNDDGSVNTALTAKKLADALRFRTIAPPNFDPNETWDRVSDIQVIDNGDGTVTVIPAQWLHDP